MSQTADAQAQPVDQHLSEDFFAKDSTTFSGCVTSSNRGPTVVCINDIAIPCTADNYTSDKIQANFLIVALVDPGWSKVPYSQQNGKTVMGDKPKPISEWATHEDETGRKLVNKNKMQCYAYLNKKGKIKDKGARVDGTDPTVNNGEPVSYTIEPGMVMRCMLKKSGAIDGTDKEKRKDFFPSDIDVIPPFSRLVVQLACKGWDKYAEGDVDPNGDEITKSDLSACYRGYGCGIVEIRVAPGSLASDRDSLQNILPPSMEEMRIKQEAYSDNNWAIRQSFQCSNVPFFVQSPSKQAFAAWDPDTSHFKIMQWDTHNADPIDIPREVMLQACNASDTDSANQLLDVALAMGAVQFVCFGNEFRGRGGAMSKFVGYPIIQASKILKTVVVDELTASVSEKGGATVTFPTTHVIGESGDSETINVLVDPITRTVETGEIQPNPELPLVCKGVALQRAFCITLAGEKCGTIWKGYYNAGKPVINTKGAGSNALANAENAVKFGRKRWGDPATSTPPAAATAAAAAAGGASKKSSKSSK